MSKTAKRAIAYLQLGARNSFEAGQLRTALAGFARGVIEGNPDLMRQHVELLREHLTADQREKLYLAFEPYQGLDDDTIKRLYDDLQGKDSGETSESLGQTA